MLKRGPRGYGFKVTPSTPVYINEVTLGSNYYIYEHNTLYMCLQS